MGPQGYTLRQLRPGVFWYTDNFYHSLFLYRSRRLTVVDFPNSPGSITATGTYVPATATLQILRGQVPKRVDMIYSHRHTDHISQANRYKTFVQTTFPGIKVFVWATKETKAFIERIPDSDIPIPNVIVSTRGRTVNLDPKLELKLMVFGGHTTEDLVAYVPPSREEPGVVHYADMLWPGGVPFADFGVTVDLGRYIAAQEDLLRLNFKYFSAGHGPLAVKGVVRSNLEYTRFVVQAARAAPEQVDPDNSSRLTDRVADPADSAFGNTQWFFNELFDSFARICERKVIERYGCQLYGVDYFAKGHCTTAVFYTSIEV